MDERFGAEGFRAVQREGQPQGGGQARLFVALALPDRVLAQLTALGKEFPGLKWTPPENLHLTLRFIGNLPEERVAAVQTALRAVKAAPFSLRLNGLGLFARPRRSILWAGLEPCPELLELKDRIDAMLALHAALAPEGGRFSPHITLSRLKDVPQAALRERVKAVGKALTGSFSACSFTLFRSRLASGGAVHTLEAVYALGSPPPEEM